LDLAGKLESFEQELSELRTHNQALQEEVERLRLDNGNLHASNQALKDEIARLKNLPLRSPFKPSGMEKATHPRPAGPRRRLMILTKAP
jgi:regulator of replication initiation timing